MRYTVWTKMAELVNHISLERKIKMASFQKRGKTWQYTISRVIDGKSKPIRKGGFKTKKEAQVAAAVVESDLGTGFVQIATNESFAAYFKEWVNVYKVDVNANTMARYKTSIKNVEDYFSAKKIQDITKRDYQIFINEYAKTHAKDTVRKLNTHVRACVRDAIDECVIRIDFTRGVKLSGNKKTKLPEEKHLDFDESEILLKETKNRLDRGLSYYCILLGITSGMRFAEMMGLQWSDFDFKNNTVRISKNWGYTAKMEQGFCATKNEQSVRTITIDQATMNEFKKLKLKSIANEHNLVFFVMTSKYHVLSNAAVNKTLKNTCKDLGIKEISVHGLRHTHASILLYKRISVYYVSERLGHADIETTHEHYAHLLKELRKEDENNTTATFSKMYV